MKKFLDKITIAVLIVLITVAVLTFFIEENIVFDLGIIIFLVGFYYVIIRYEIKHELLKLANKFTDLGDIFTKLGDRLEHIEKQFERVEIILKSEEKRLESEESRLERDIKKIKKGKIQ